MKQFAVNQLTTMRWSLDEVVQHYLAAGVGAVGLWRRKVTDFGEAQACDLIRQSGLRVSNLFWAGDFLGNHLLSFREALEDGLEAIQLTSQLNCRTLVIYSGGRANHTLKHSRRVLREALRELLPVAQSRGVNLAMELIHPQYADHWTVFPQMEELLEFVATIGQPGLRIALDSYHWGLQSNALKILPELLPHVGLVSLSDGRTTPVAEEQRCRLGDGIVPLSQLIEALQVANYQGYYDLKLLGAEFERSNCLELIHHGRAVFDRLKNGTENLV